MTSQAKSVGLRKPVFVLGFIACAAALGGIAHFTISAALAGFPAEVLTEPWNWLFVGSHVFFGVLGLCLLSLARPSRPAAQPEKATSLEPIQSSQTGSPANDRADDEEKAGDREG